MRKSRVQFPPWPPCLCQLRPSGRAPRLYRGLCGFESCSWLHRCRTWARPKWLRLWVRFPSGPPRKGVRMGRRRNSEMTVEQIRVQREANLRHYYNNKASYRRRSKSARAKCRQLAREAKSKPCCDCGVQYPFYVMQFDHVHDDKVCDVGKLANRGLITAMLAEISKCEVVCANCHAERTWQRMLGEAKECGGRL
jgi:hypothetical protein